MFSKSSLAAILGIWLIVATMAGASEVETAIVEAKRLVGAGLAQAALDRLEPLAVGPATARVTAEIAAIRFQSHDFAGAAVAYQRLVELVPGNIVATRNLLIALYRAERIAAARKILADLGDPMLSQDARMLAVRGLIAAQEKQPERAVADLEAAAALAPEDTFAIYELGLLHLAQGSPAEAVKALQEAVRRNPRSGSAHYNLGQALIRTGETETGRAALGRATEISRQVNAEQIRRSRGVALAVRAQEHLVAGDTAAALQDLDSAAAIFPDDPQLAMLRERALGASQASPP